MTRDGFEKRPRTRGRGGYYPVSCPTTGGRTGLHQFLSQCFTTAKHRERFGRPFRPCQMDGESDVRVGIGQTTFPEESHVWSRRLRPCQDRGTSHRSTLVVE